VIEHGEIEAVSPFHVHELVSCGITNTRALHLDYVGTHPCKQLGTSGARLDMYEIQNSYTVEWL
jgi:hypothetical protein